MRSDICCCIISRRPTHKKPLWRLPIDREMTSQLLAGSPTPDLTLAHQNGSDPLCVCSQTPCRGIVTHSSFVKVRESSEQPDGASRESRTLKTAVLSRIPMPIRLPKHIWCFGWDSNPQILVPKTNAYASSATKAYITFSAFCIYIISKI